MRHRPYVLALICLAVLCIILNLGLWPFHAPRNGVSWRPAGVGLRLGRDGTVMSAGPVTLDPRMRGPSFSIELVYQSARPYSSGTLLALYDPQDGRTFALLQSDTGIQLHTEERVGPFRNIKVDRDVEYFKRRTRPMFLTVTSGAQGTTVYVDGVPAATFAGLQPFPPGLNGAVILGDSPGQNNTWTGVMLGLALYSVELSSAQVARNYNAWAMQKPPEAQEGLAALYLFDEGKGDVVHNRARPGADLNIPETYQVVDKIALEPFWDEFNWSRSYGSSVVKNIIGFLPWGMVVYPLLAGPVLAGPGRRKGAALLTVISGTAVSLTIEVAQIYLPTRESGTSDLITNTLGTWGGVYLYHTARRVLGGRWPVVDSVFFP